MKVPLSLLAPGACERYPEFEFASGEPVVSSLTYIFATADTEYSDRAGRLGFKMAPSDYFRCQGCVTSRQGKFTEPTIPLIGEDNIMWGSNHPHPDPLWADPLAVLGENLFAISPPCGGRLCVTASRDTTH